MSTIELSARQRTILEWVKENGPLSSKELADRLQVSRASTGSGSGGSDHVRSAGSPPRVSYYCSGKNWTLSPACSMALRQEAHSISVAVREKTSVYDVIVKMFIEDVGTCLLSLKKAFSKAWFRVKIC